MPAPTYRTWLMERALFVVGKQDSGKSNQLRGAFRDVRFGTDTNVPSTKPRDFYRLSNERSLYLRLSSPHEKYEWIGERPSGHAAENFIDLTETKITSHLARARRWNFAGALQPFADRNMPDAADTLDAFVAHFSPERVRVLFLSPDRHGAELQADHEPIVKKLRKNPRIELAWIDARLKHVNGLMIADFFDFT